jgi:site-specific DNA-methyltransferase (adenine-specific)
MTAPQTNDPPRNTILVGDVRERLAELPDNSINCIITSPPYFALRDYGHAGQLGAEPTVDDWAKSVVDVASDLARVLRPDGALWLNLGDGYSRHLREGTLKKSLLLGPERVAMQLTASGWLLRNKVVWSKRNPMPSSVRDRLTTTHETIYFLTRSAHYFFDLDVIRESAPSDGTRLPRTNSQSYPPRDAVPSLHHGTTPRVDLNQGLAAMKAAGRETHPLGKNPGDVWTLPTANYRGAHFATFPLELIRRPLLATCPERVCVRCGVPWQRAAQVVDGRQLAIGGLRPACTCRAAWRPGVVLDPFMGSGTVALAAETHGRDWVGIELNPAYAALAEARIASHRTAGPDPNSP